MLLFFYKKGKVSLVKKIILSLVVEAEKYLGSKTGDLKYAFVVKNLYNILPLSLRVLFTQKQIDDFIEEAVQYLKIYLSEDKNLMSYDNENLKVLLDNLNL